MNQDFRAMTADTIGKDILAALVSEIRLLPKSWPELSKAKQDDVIERLRNRVADNVSMAVHMLAAQGRTVVAGDLDQITIKDGVKAVVKFGAGAANLHELFEVAGQSVLVVVANAADHTGGMDGIQGESDQRAMDLGHEYHDNDGGGMEPLSGDIIDAEVLGLPSPDQVKPTDEEKEQAILPHNESDEAWDDGYAAAEAGKSLSYAPLLSEDLYIRWCDGWKAFQRDNETDWWKEHGKEESA